MSLGLLFVPLAAALTLVFVVGLASRVQFPSTAARFGLAFTAAAVVAYVPSVLLVALGYLSHLPLAGSGARWCALAFGMHAAIPTWLGLPAVAAVVAGSWRAARLIRRMRAVRDERAAPVAVVSHGEPFAVTLPGRGGRVVISSAMVELLDDRERAVVLAHERSHAVHRHDRYLLMAEIGAAVLPLLRPLASRVRLSVERWADEDAAAAVGDRGFVAVTLGKVALRGHAPAGAALAFGGGQVVSRVAALLGSAPVPPRAPVLAGLWASGVVAIGLAFVQVHHLDHLAAALCPH